jgi:copper transport protein
MTVVVLAVGGLPIVVPDGVASAHASIEAITPSDGTLLSTAPTEVRVTFSEPIDEVFVEADVITSTTPLTGALGASRDPNDDRVLVISLPVLADGSYQLGFSVRDEIDLHEVRGRTSFAIGDHAVVAASPPEAPGAQPWESAARWAFATGMGLAVGVLVVRRRWPDVPVASPTRLVALTAAGVALLAAGRLGVIAARAADLETGWGAAMRSVARTGDVARLPVVAVALACLVPLLLPRRWQWLDTPLAGRTRTSTRVALGAAGVIWLALLAGWADHAALDGTVEPAVALAKSAHLLGLGAWMGTLIVTIAVNAGGGRVGDALRAVRREVVGGAVVAVASGFLLAGRLVISLTAVFATTFGRLLVVKLAVILIACVLGLARRRGARGASIEAIALGVIVLAGATMATAGPAVDSAYLPAPSAQAPVLTTTTVDDLILRVRAVPARPGPNDLEITIASRRRPAAPISTVTVRITTPGGEHVVDVRPDADGAAVVSGLDLPEGASALEVAVERPGRPTVLAGTTVATAPLAYHHPVIVSSRPIRSALRWAALAVALAGVALAAASRSSGVRAAPIDGRHRHRHPV